jgi:DNA-binding XRE family transcriptional regulator
MSIEAMKQALEALEIEDSACRHEKEMTPEHIASSIAALRQAIEQAEKQEPVGEIRNVVWGGMAWNVSFISHKKLNLKTKLYTAPPKLERVGLTDEEEIELDEQYGDDINAYIDARDAKLKEKNT